MVGAAAFRWRWLALVAPVLLLLSAGAAEAAPLAGPPVTRPPLPTRTTPEPPTIASVALQQCGVGVIVINLGTDNGFPTGAVRVTALPGGMIWGGFADLALRKATVQVSGLAYGVSYSFTATAANSAGTSAPSPSVVASAGPCQPDAPKDVEAVADDGKATITFTPPLDRGSPITSYRVHVEPVSAPASGFDTSGSGTPIVVKGLKNGTAYRFTVSAINTLGPGPGSSSAPVTPTGAIVPTPATGGKAVLLAARTKSAGCRLAASPDRGCSPGAYSAKLTTAVICAPRFGAGAIGAVSQSQRYAVQRAYGLAAKSYGSAIVIDHIVPLELGGSEDVANLYPQKASGGRVKDKLEHKLRTLVCSGAMTLPAAQRRIAADWQAVYRNVFGTAPSP